MRSRLFEFVGDPQAIWFTYSNNSIKLGVVTKEQSMLYLIVLVVMLYARNAYLHYYFRECVCCVGLGRGKGRVGSRRHSITDYSYSAS